MLLQNYDSVCGTVPPPGTMWTRRPLPEQVTTYHGRRHSVHHGSHDDGITITPPSPVPIANQVPNPENVNRTNAQEQGLLEQEALMRTSRRFSLDAQQVITVPNTDRHQRTTTTRQQRTGGQGELIQRRARRISSLDGTQSFTVFTQPERQVIHPADHVVGDGQPQEQQQQQRSTATTNTIFSSLQQRWSPPLSTLQWSRQLDQTLTETTRTRLMVLLMITLWMVLSDWTTFSVRFGSPLMVQQAFAEKVPMPVMPPLMVMPGGGRVPILQEDESLLLQGIVMNTDGDEQEGQGGLGATIVMADATSSSSSSSRSPPSGVRGQGQEPVIQQQQQQQQPEQPQYPPGYHRIRQSPPTQPILSPQLDQQQQNMFGIFEYPFSNMDHQGQLYPASPFTGMQPSILIKRKEQADGSHQIVHSRQLAPGTSLLAVNDPNLKCNNRTDLCDLRYNQVTYPGTHNSAAYNLEVDCELATTNCLSSESLCTQQALNCTMGFITQCNKITNTCLDHLPNWLHWLCGAFSSVCEGTEQFCLGWEEICTSSVEVCVLYGSTCEIVIPEWALPCLWENQDGHTITQQLNDGIRFLDLGTCLLSDNKTVVMCHGSGSSRAIGQTLDQALSQIAQFYVANPNEILTIEFNEVDGDWSIVSAVVTAKLKQYFSLPNGDVMFWNRTSLGDPWPTLRQMIAANKRMVLFYGNIYWGTASPIPGWINQKDTWKLDGFEYCSLVTTPTQLNASYFDHCAQGPPTDGSFIQWQQIDINLGILASDIIATLKNASVPQLCIGPLAVETNSDLMTGIANYCYDKWPYWFRIRVNDYWQGNLFPLVNHFNDLNVARVKAGNGTSITPY